MTDLDHDLRLRLRSAAEAESGGGAHDSGVAAAMGEIGPKLVRSGRRRRVARRVAAGAALCLPVAAALWVNGLFGADPGVRPVATAPAEPCEGWAGGPSVGAVDGFVDHGRFAVAVDGTASIAEATGCATRVELARGAVDVHARDLGGGRLVVASPRGEVEVRGTVFRVSVEDDALDVWVAEGRVEVRPRDGDAVEVGGGERYREGEGVQELPEARSAELLDAVAGWTRGEGPADPDVTPPAPRTGDEEASESDARLAAAASRSARARERRAGTRRRSAGAPLTVDEHVAAAEAALRRGDLDAARASLRRAGAGQGATAEAAWVRLSRIELRAGRPGAALRALDARRRFRGGFFDAEALWLEVQARERAGDETGAVRAARRLVSQHGSTSQATVAMRWLDERER